MISWLVVLLVMSGGAAWANQKEEDLSDSVRTSMRGLVNDRSPAQFFDSRDNAVAWLQEMESRLRKMLPRDSILRQGDMLADFLIALHYESTRAGLDPQLVLAVVHVESFFRKYAISTAGARGYMQVMPFWVGVIGEREHNLFKLRTNLRYGTVILRHYLEIENGNVARALARYNGSLGRNTYPNLVLTKLEDYWLWEQ